MRRITLAVAFTAVVVLALSVSQRIAHSSEKGKAARRVLYYVDPMHPAYRSAKPGIAPDCGMPLEPVFSQPNEDSSSGTGTKSDLVRVEAPVQQAFGIHSVEATKRVVTRTVRVVGRVLPEDSRIFNINSGVDGFIRETYRDSVGLQVAKNQKLATYYAPEFIAAASGFLAANERVPGSVSNEGARSIQNYSDRLRNLGMSDVQIHRVAEMRQLPESIEIVSPTDGVVLARSISPGQHFGHETQFYQIADLSRIWVVAEVDQADAPFLKPGSKSQISIRGNGRPIPAHVTESLPQADLNGGTVKLQLEADNPGYVLRPQMLVDVDFPVRLSPAITIPLEALLDSGAQARVYVEHEDGVMEARQVETGWRTPEFVEIRRGLRVGERVVATGAFLIDSESRLKATDLKAGNQAQRPAREIAATGR